jgi:hypothetical protein
VARRRRPPGPGPKPVLLRPGRCPAIARVARLPLGLLELVEPVVGSQEPFDQHLEGGHPLLGDAEVELAGDRGEVLGSGTLNGHGYPQRATAAAACLRVQACVVNADLAQHPPDERGAHVAAAVRRRCRRARLSARMLPWTGRPTMRDLPPNMTDYLATRASFGWRFRSATTTPAT